MGYTNLPLISVVVPVYNVELYIDRCIKSIISQTYTNLEIILVDDGSTDKSGKKCDEYSNKDSRITVIHKVNGGLSDARNCGIEVALGEYITFVDSDDSIAFDMIEYLYGLIKKFRCRMSICSHYVAFREGKKLVNQGNGKEEKLDAKTCIKRLCYHDQVDTSAWAKLYELSIFDNVKFPKGKLFEDIGTIYKTFIESKNVACGFKPKYYYYVRENSIVTSTFSPKKLDLIEMTDRMGEDVLALFPDLEKAVCRRRVYARFSTLNQMLDCKDWEIEKNRIIEYIKRNSSVILKCKSPVRDKIAIVILWVGLGLYKYSWKIFKKRIKGS